MNRLKLALAAWAALGAAQATWAANVRTAVVHLGVDATGLFSVANILDSLSTDARFLVIDSLDADESMPTAAALAPYDSLLVVTDNRSGALPGGGLGTQLGNVLDDYLVGGGRVVLTAFSGNSDLGVDGEIEPFLPFSREGLNGAAGGLDFATAATSHFVFANVSSFSAAFASDIALKSPGILLGSYLSGLPAVLTVPGDDVMMVNAFPGYGSDLANGTDFGRLFANALAGVPEPHAGMLAGVAFVAAATRRRRLSRR